MRKLIKHTGSLVFAVLPSLLACTRPYNSPATTAVTNYLVVEGIINPGSDSSVAPLLALTQGSVITGFYGFRRYCADCRTRGTNIKPSFWP